MPNNCYQLVPLGGFRLEMDDGNGGAYRVSLSSVTSVSVKVQVAVVVFVLLHAVVLERRGNGRLKV